MAAQYDDDTASIMSATPSMAETMFGQSREQLKVEARKVRSKLWNRLVELGRTRAALASASPDDEVAATEIDDWDNDRMDIIVETNEWARGVKATWPSTE